VQSIARQTLRSNPSPATFMASFEGRLSALAKAHELLVQSNWKGASLQALAQTQLQPYASDDGERLRLEGEPVSLPSELATPFGLVLHELAANAAKYGSLSRPSGSVNVTWRLEPGNDGNRLVVVWNEKSDVHVKQFSSSGLGTALIDQGIPGASVKRTFGPEGFTCTIEFVLPRAADDAGAMG
jgi:two-component system CheB/CheR fusion protein